MNSGSSLRSISSEKLLHSCNNDVRRNSFFSQRSSLLHPKTVKSFKKIEYFAAESNSSSFDYPARPVLNGCIDVVNLSQVRRVTNFHSSLISKRRRRRRSREEKKFGAFIELAG